MNMQPDQRPPVTIETLILTGGGIGFLLIVLGVLGSLPILLVLGVVTVFGSVGGGIVYHQRHEEIAHRRAMELRHADPLVLIADGQNKAAVKRVKLKSASKVKRVKREAKRDLDLARLQWEIKRDSIALTEPRAIRQDTVRLIQSLTSLNLAAWEKADKDPSFRKVYEQAVGLVTQTDDALDALLRDLSSTSTATPEQLQKRHETAADLLLQLFERFVGKLA